MKDVYQPPTYPLIQFWVSHGIGISAVIAVALVLLGLAVLMLGFGWLAGLACIVLGILGYIVLGSYVEVLRIISETLMPR